MPKIIPRHIENKVFMIYRPPMTYRRVQELLKQSGVILNDKTIKRILNSEGKRRQAEIGGVKFQHQRVATTLTPEVVGSIRTRIEVENPPTLKSIASDMNISCASVFRAIHDKLSLATKKKRKVQVLNLKNKHNRLKNCRKLYKNQLAGDKCNYVVTLDESWARLQVDGDTTQIYYARKGEEKNWVLQRKSNWEQKFMIVGAMSYYGTFPLIRIGKETVNSEVYVNQVLKPIIHDCILPLFEGELSKVFVHFDKSPVHVSKFTQDFMDQITMEYGIKFISKDDIPVKGADCAPLDFFGFGYLKQKVNKTGPKNLDQLWNELEKSWLHISPETCNKVYGAWKRRCRAIVERQGSHIEHVRTIHSHKIPLKSLN